MKFKSLFKYREKILTECEEDKRIAKRAIKFDGKENNLKEDIGYAILKSCDYIKYTKKNILYIEISNLKKQYTNLNKEYNSIKNNYSNIKKSKLFIQPKKIIINELRDKCIQTDLFLCKLQEYVRYLETKEKIFIVSICISNPSDVIVFEPLKKELLTDLKNSLKKIIDDIQIISVEHLETVINNYQKQQ